MTMYIILSVTGCCVVHFRAIIVCPDPIVVWVRNTTGLKYLYTIKLQGREIIIYALPSSSIESFQMTLLRIKRASEILSLFSDYFWVTYT